MDVIPKISMIGTYKGYTDEKMMATDTPFDQFDLQCHQVGTGIASVDSKDAVDDEDELLFLIATAHHIGRPNDMLMFLGEYFKKTIKETITAE